MLPLSDWQRLPDEVAAIGRGDPWLRIGGLKGLMDGSLGSRGSRRVRRLFGGLTTTLTGRPHGAPVEIRRPRELGRPHGGRPGHTTFYVADCRDAIQRSIFASSMSNGSDPSFSTAV